MNRDVSVTAHRVADDLIVWQAWLPAAKADCTSAALRIAAGWVVIDPIPLDETSWIEATGGGTVTGIILTSGNHQRASLAWKARWKVPLWAPEGADGDVIADAWYDESSAPLAEVSVIALPGGGAGESALLHGGRLLVGDALLHLNGLEILPAKYCADAKLLKRSLRKLKDVSFESICFAHGLPIVTRVRERLQEVL